MQRKKVKSFTRSVRIKTPDDTNHFSYDSISVEEDKKKSKTVKTVKGKPGGPS